MKHLDDLPQPPTPPLPETDLDMESFHEMAANGQLSEIMYRLAGCNVVPFRRKPKRSDP
jgi:hypothetical protein